MQVGVEKKEPNERESLSELELNLITGTKLKTISQRVREREREKVLSDVGDTLPLSLK